jgi:hypothetical protein
MNIQKAIEKWKRDMEFQFMNNEFEMNKIQIRALEDKIKVKVFKKHFLTLKKAKMILFFLKKN